MDVLNFSVLFELEVHLLISSMLAFCHYFKLLLFNINTCLVCGCREASLL